MQDQELVILYKQLYLAYKDYSYYLECDNGWHLMDGIQSQPPVSNNRAYYENHIKNLEDKIDNGILDEMVRIVQEMGVVYETGEETKEDLYYK